MLVEVFFGLAMSCMGFKARCSMCERLALE